MTRSFLIIIIILAAYLGMAMAWVLNTSKVGNRTPQALVQSSKVKFEPYLGIGEQIDGQYRVWSRELYAGKVRVLHVDGNLYMLVTPRLKSINRDGSVGIIPGMHLKFRLREDVTGSELTILTFKFGHNFKVRGIQLEGKVRTLVRVAILESGRLELDFTILNNRDGFQVGVLGSRVLRSLHEGF